MKRHRFTSIVLGLLLLLAGCKGPERLSPHNLLEGEILNVVHGCSGFETYRNNIPPNTLEGLEHSLAEGADGLEIDVQMTADSHLVLFHDATLDAHTTCQGCIHAKTLAEVQQCRLKTRNGPIDGDFALPLLDSALAKIAKADRDVWVFVNTKHGTPCEPTGEEFSALFARSVAQHVRNADLGDYAIVESLDAAFLDRVHETDSTLRLLFDDEDFERGMATVRSHRFLGLAIGYLLISAAQVQQAHQEGYWLGIWGVKIMADCKAAVAKGPEFIMTDDVLMLQAALQK